MIGMPRGEIYGTNHIGLIEKSVMITDCKSFKEFLEECKYLLKIGYNYKIYRYYEKEKLIYECEVK